MRRVKLFGSERTLKLVGEGKRNRAC